MKRFYIKTAALLLALPLALGGCSLMDAALSDNTPAAPQTTQPSIDALRQQYQGYGFQALQTEAEQRLYANIDAAANKLESKQFLTPRLDNLAHVSDVLEFYKDDHPEVFWIDDTEPYYFADDADGLTIELHFRLSGEELAQAKETLETQVQTALADAPQNGTAYERELYVHDYLIDNCEYDDEAVELHKTDQVRSNEQNAYGALVEGRAVCEGYARAFQLLCQRLNVPCWVVQGKVEGFGNQDLANHIWNCVQLDDDWYQVDVTWDDTEDNEMMDCERYLYLNLTTEEIEKDHQIAPDYSEYTTADTWYNGYVPPCDSTDYCYLIQNAAPLSDLDSDSLPEYLAESAAAYAQSCVFLVDESVDFDDTYNQIVKSYAYNWITQANEINGYSPVLSDRCTVTSGETRRLIALILDYE